MNHPQPHDLTALAYALVPSPEREHLLEHIAQCDACRQAYDVAFEEQALVRDVMFEEVRSGEAEARALDKVLSALKSGDNVPVEGREGRVLGLFSPWGLALQVAASLAIAAGVFYVAVLMPNSEAPAAPSTESGAVAANEIPVKSGDVMVLADGTPGLEGARWKRAAGVPVGAWCRNDGTGPLVFALDGAELQFESGAYFQLQPNDGDVSVYVLRGDASVNSPSRVLNVITNTNEFRALPGTAFEVGCDYAFVPSQRGRSVSAPDGKTLVRASVRRGDVLVLPSGETWESPRVGILREGRRLDVQTRSRQMHAEGVEFDERQLEEVLAKLKETQPRLHDELQRAARQLGEQAQQLDLVFRIVLDNRLELTQRGSRVEIRDGGRELILTVDADNNLVAELTINAETQTHKASGLDELARKVPSIADVLGGVTLADANGGKRTISIKRAFFEKQEMQEPKQQRIR